MPVRRGLERHRPQPRVGGDDLAGDGGQAHPALADDAPLQVRDVGDERAGGQGGAEGVEVAPVLLDGDVLGGVVGADGEGDDRRGSR